MVEQYRKANDRIHVPEELMQRTKEAVRQEEKSRRSGRYRDTQLWRRVSV